MCGIDAFLQLLTSLRLRKARALLLFLSPTPNRPHRTEKIIDLLWQDKPARQAAASFRQTVRQIRIAAEQVPSFSIHTGGGTIALNAPAGWSLEGGLVAALGQADWSEKAADMVRSYVSALDLLQGISGSFDSWLAITQAGAGVGTRRVLDARLAAPNPGPAAFAAARFALELEPSNEIAVRFLMNHHWQHKAATRAIEVYNSLYHYLDDSFDQEPEAETVALLAAIKLDPTGQGADEPVVLSRPKISIMVQAPQEPGADREMASLQSVLITEIRMRLSRFREWRVIDEGSSEAPYLIVHPHLQRFGNQAWLTVEVKRPSQGDLLWSEIIKNPIEGWEDKIRPLLVNIANALSIVVADRSGSDTGAQVYDRWLQSQLLLDAWSPESEARALNMLRDITREAPGFGPAHAELAGALNVRHVLLPGTFQTEDVKQNALHHALEAVSIDPLDTRAHRVLGWCYCHKSEFELAEFHFEQALALNRKNPLTLASCALGFAFSQNIAHAIELVSEVRRHPETMEPFHLIYLAAADYLTGNYESAVSGCEKGAGLMSTVGGWHAAALAKLGDSASARTRMRSYLDEIGTLWCGEQPFSQAAAIDWFTASFPLRHAGMQQDLHATLNGILPG